MKHRSAFFLIFASLSSLPSAFAGECTANWRSYQNCLKGKDARECHEQIIRAYTGSLYRELNASLREARSSDCDNLASAMVEALSEQPRMNPGYVYRRSNVPELTELAVGQCFSDRGFLSTSTSEAMTTIFGTMRLRIKGFSGRSVRGCSAVECEEEIIFAPGTPLRLEDNSRGIYEFTEVAVDACPNPEVVRPLGKPIQLTIEAARYGEADVTAPVAEFCAGRSQCPGYRIFPKYLKLEGDAPSTFSVRWSCARDAEKTRAFSFTVPAPAMDAIVTFGCDEKLQPVLTTQRLNGGLASVFVESIVDDRARAIALDLAKYGEPAPSPAPSASPSPAAALPSSRLRGKIPKNELPSGAKSIRIRYHCEGALGTSASVTKDFEVKDGQAEFDLRCVDGLKLDP